MIVRRLGALTAPRLSGQDHDLCVCGHVHTEPSFGDGNQLHARRCIANLGIEPNSLVSELAEARLHAAHLTRLRVSIAAARDDGGGREDETDEHSAYYPAASYGYAARRHARSRALRARGLREISSSE